ncbi:unnamed protein product [Malassezia sympodialis ATCC 42132]|uniref:Uncharacterized protein n=1 Tax=Malassezia sympodialis (strain ATCC 42132) TaxID=1230383 RepID=M5E8R6_MALS4|nr:uncharacterized protein MSY001_1573 [Malassezia sympodialis ATCC 42132]CCU98867.1 unnamed protein product [Malassezia sympodialis ATCC 42132]SHO79042.1 Uncharacterized protein MSYG_3391 [Malassezia sympodialis ATCC 42132]|eukprot:XP_018740148.1 uncharacterized protein MSY001_1573 [Malassezia sympodialis ATCC 42132]
MASAAGGLDVFEPARFETLYGILHTVVSAPAAAVPTWYLDVERNRAALATLGRVKPPSEAERRDISKGIIVLEGHAQSLNADFVAQTLLLSDELHVSETYAASLLQEGIAASARWGRTPTEVACLLFYREHLALLACLKELASGAYTLCVGGDLAAGVRMSRLLDELVQGDELVQRLLEAMRSYPQARERVRAAMQRASASPRLSDEVQMERTTWLEQAEQEVGHIVYLLALARRLAPPALEALVAHLAQSQVAPAPAPATALYALMAVLAALDTVPDEAGEWLARHATSPVHTAEALCADAGLLSRLWTAATGAWQHAGLQHMVQLALALFIAEALANHAALSASLGHTMEDVHALALRALTADDDASALVFLAVRVLGFRRVLDGDLEERPPVIDAEFQEYVLQQVQHLMLSVTTTFFPLLRKMQRSEEDSAFASLRAARPGAPPPARRFDIEALFDVMALLCRGRPEAGLPFWQGQERGLSRFLLWAVDTREPGQQRALFDMLAALAEGEQCAAYAHALLEYDAGAPPGGERRLVTWSRLFEWIAHYVDAFQRHASAVMPPDEMVLLRAFLGVLATVVRYSAATRDALFLHKEYAPLDKLFALYACAVPVDLKAAILQALTAFAARPRDATSPRVLSALWERLEQSGAVRGAAPRAVYELEHVEAVHGRYPGTRRLVELLTAVLPYATPAAQADALVAHVQGHGALPPAHAFTATGAAPYVAFVIEQVLLAAPRRLYAQPAERWALSAACIEFLDRCLAAFSLAPLDTKEALAKHPGFDILRRLLSGSALLQELLVFVHPDPSLAGFEVVNQDRAQTPEFARAVRGVLRILLRVLDVQPLLLHTLLPAWSDAVVGDRAQLVPLEVHLLHAHQVVVQLALYVNCIDADMAWLSVRLVSALARTSTFQASDAFGPLRARTSMNRLAGLLEMTGEAARVTSGAVAWLDAKPDSTESPTEAADPLSAPAGAAQVQEALLELLLAQTARHVPAPNVAHLLLGFEPEATAPDRLVHGARGGLLPALLARVQPPVTLPSLLVERCLAVLHQVCMHPFTSTATLRFLRTHDFVATQLTHLSAQPAAEPAASGALVLHQGEVVPTRAESALAWLHIHAHVLALVALELHTLVGQDQLGRVAPLLSTLLGEPAMQGRGASSGQWLALLHTSEVQWDDAHDAHDARTAALLAPAVVSDVLVSDKVYDLSAVAALLLEQRSAMEPAAWMEQARARLLWAAAQNTRRAMAVARREAFQACCEVLDVLMNEVLAAVRSDARVPLLLDVASALLPRLRPDEDDAYVSDLAASTLLHALYALRGQLEPPNDRLLAILRGMLESIDRGLSAAARSDVYLAVTCLTQLAMRGAGPLGTRVRTLLATHAPRLVDVAARDALDGTDVVQTVALTTLTFLASLEAAAPPMRVGPLLSSRGYLASLARRLQELDRPLQAALAPDPPSLNAQYVYEALMALLVRLASSCAPLVLDARVVDVLARVDFPSMRPEHTLDDVDGFLPPVAERYASLLTPLLQLLAALLAHAPGASSSVQAVLVAHQDALLAILHGMTHAAPGVTDVEQGALLVHLLSSLTPPAPFHAAVLSVAALYLVPQAHELLAPQTPTEREDTAILAPTLNGLVQQASPTRLTLFEQAARRSVDRLVRALIRYMEYASAHGEARAILVPSLHVGRATDHAASSGRVVAAPSLGVAIAALREQLASLSAAVQSLERVEAVRADPHALHADEWADLAADAGVAPSLAPSAQRVAGEKAVQQAADVLHHTVEAKLDMVERWMVLLVRHLDLFTRLGTSRAAGDVPALRAGAQTALAPVLDEHLAYLALPPCVGPEAAEHVAFLQMAARRIADRLRPEVA